jgi:hypothetical protein
MHSIFTGTKNTIEQNTVEIPPIPRFTSVEVILVKLVIELNMFAILTIPAKHGKLPSVDDIKEGFIKMILFTNLKDVTVDNVVFNHIPVLKLTADNKINLTGNELINNAIKESEINNFKLILPSGSSL